MGRLSAVRRLNNKIWPKSAVLIKDIHLRDRAPKTFPCEKPMPNRPILSSMLAIMLLSGTAASAAAQSDGGLSLPKIGLPKLFGNSEPTARPVQMAQASDPRITALEEQIRSLSGTVEELNFQILQMQEQLRKMQEDNEFRFQELEGKKTDAGVAGDNRVAEVAPSVAAPRPEVEAAPGNVPSVEEIIIEEDGQTAGTTAAPGEPPRTFGTITFDEKGNVTGGSVGDQMAEVPANESVTLDPPSAPAAQEAPSPDRTVVAALPSSDDPDELYRNSYEFILSGDYGTAEAGFRNHIERFPNDQKAADARFWLGESLLGQKKYRDAAEIFLAANKEFPSAKKAPEMLLKLGVSLAGLDQRDVACATFSEIGKRYPDISAPLQDRVKQEQALAAC